VGTGGLTTFDLETGDATDLYRGGAEYIRIGATAADHEPVIVFDGLNKGAVAREVVYDIRQAERITGHNIMAFDLPALVREGGLTMPEVHRMAAEGRIFDALLAARYQDPPMARDKGVDATRKYDLGALGEKHGLGAKLSDVSKALAKKHGGWANIPIDDSEDGVAFKGYMVQDVELSRRLYATLMEQFGGTMPDYLVREHRVAAIASQISLNGFRVDPVLLATRVNEVRDRKGLAMERLAEDFGIPTEDAKGKRYLSPLASKAGKVALEAALVEAGVPAKALWRTEKSGDLQVSSEAMLHYGQDYGHLPKVVAIAKDVWRIVSARSVYETINNHLALDGRVHPKVSFKQATGRWSLTEPGMTVLGKRAGKHVERDVLLADPDELLIAVDLSQVDMRAVAGLSQDAAYIEMLHHDDPHSELAVALFGSASFREQAKAIGHGWNYGESLRRISQENDIDPRLVQRFDRSMRERFPRLVEWRDEVRALAESGALLDNGFGRLMRADPQRAHTQAPALKGQGAARDIMMAGMLRLPAEILPMLRAQVHDEIVLSVPADQVKEIGQTVIDALSFSWDGGHPGGITVPITADVSRPGASWGMCYVKG
jgi:DNA polymerase-1